MNDQSTQRKRQLKDDADVESSKKSMIVSLKKEPIDTDAFGDTSINCSNPILTSIISSHPPPTQVASTVPKDQEPVPPFNYLMLFNAFRQFLNGYLQAGGDPTLANTLANYVSALPIPPNPLKPLNMFDFGAPTMPRSDPVKKEPNAEPKEVADHPTSSSSTIDASQKKMTLSSALGEDVHQKEESSSKGDSTSITKPLFDMKPVSLPAIPHFPILPLLPTPPPTPEATEIQRLREAAFGRYKNVLCVICNEWICSRNRKNHIEAHLNYRPYKCSACDYARRREIFVIQHIKTHHKGQEGVEMLSSVDLHIAIEVDRLADECVKRTRKLIDNMQEKKDGSFGENKDFDEKALELMMAEESEKKVVVIESVTEVRPKVANYHRRQRTKVLKKIYDTDAAKQTELKIVKDEEGSVSTIQLEEGFQIKLEDLIKMVEAGGSGQEGTSTVTDEVPTEN